MGYDRAMADAKAKAGKGISKRESIKLLKENIRGIDVEITRLRAQQQGMEKALSILKGEGP